MTNVYYLEPYRGQSSKEVSGGFARRRFAAGRQWLCGCVVTVLMMMLNGCLAPPLKPETGKLQALTRILVVPVEAPPLEVLPDPIVDGIYAIEHVADSLPLSRFVSEKIYRNLGGVLIAGLIDSDDPVPEAPLQTKPPEAGQITGLQPLAELQQNWTSSVVIAEAAVARMNTMRDRAALGSRYRLLPMADEDRTTYLGNWNEAIRQWYNQENPAIDYRQLAAQDIDAVLEVGVGDYRIFYGQTSLQVLFKLIDPGTGRVIGRVSVKDYSPEDSASALLSEEAKAFKTVIARMGASLIAAGLTELGLGDGFHGYADNSGRNTAASVVR